LALTVQKVLQSASGDSGQTARDLMTSNAVVDAASKDGFDFEHDTANAQVATTTQQLRNAILVPVLFILCSFRFSVVPIVQQKTQQTAEKFHTFAPNAEHQRPGASACSV
jgi:hypothetical protein